jgi:phosphate starvation-inducible protein PhoH
VVRHKLVQRIVNAYKDHGDKAAAAKSGRPAAAQARAERDA